MNNPNYSEYILEFGKETNEMDGIINQDNNLEINTSSASVPIPGGHRGTRGVYDQFSPSPLTVTPIWGTKPDPDDSQFGKMESDSFDITFKMEDDDIFQVDKADLIQGPTLAELNANEDMLSYCDLNFDDLLLPEDKVLPFKTGPQVTQISQSGGPLIGGPSAGFASSSFPQSTIFFKNIMPYINPATSSFIINSGITIIDNPQPVTPPNYPTTSNIAGSMDSCFDVGSSTPSSTTSPNPICISKPVGQSTLHELLKRKGESPTPNSKMKQKDPTSMDTGNNKLKVSRLSMSAPSQTMGLEQLWARREPRQHLLSTGSLVEAESTSSLSTGGALSPDPLGHTDQLSHDEGYEESDDDSDHYEDYSSDNESGSDGEDHGSIKDSRETKQSKREKYFWQYNVQAKGPKGQRLVAHTRLEDPHVLNEVTDPVFSPNCALRGIKHSGKARKGDGNDLTPNPRKLHNIGKELDKLSRIINDMTPVSELPFTARPKTRKEKNKLASRACRLKKKAQHEANKIKLHGLELEHRRLINGIAQMKSKLAAKLTESNPEVQEDLTRQMEKICRSATKLRIANDSTDFVNKILDKVKAGVPDGGIDDY